MTTRLSLALLVAASGLRAQAPERFPLPGDAVAVYNLAGILRVEAGSGADVIVELTRGGRDAAKLKIETGALRDRNALRVIYPDDEIYYAGEGGYGNSTLEVRDDGTFGDDRDDHRGWSREGHEVRITSRRRGSGGLEASADLRVRVPKGKNVAVNLGVGKAFVTNVEGTIRISVSSADVATDRTRGSLRVSTGSGNVDLRSAAGDVNLSTGSGDITASGIDGSMLRLETGSGTIKLSDGKAGTIYASTGSGDIDATSASGDELSFETGSGDIDVALIAAFRSVHIETGSGDVTLKVPSTAGAEVDIDTGSGDIDLGGLTLTVRKVSHDHVTGTLGDGKGRVSVETGSGNVHLEKL